MPGTGRPTQFHGVPFEERAPDGKGGKLPFALEYPTYQSLPSFITRLTDLRVAVTLMPRVVRNALSKRKAHSANRHDAKLPLEPEVQLQQRKKSTLPWTVFCQP